MGLRDDGRVLLAHVVTGHRRTGRFWAVVHLGLVAGGILWWLGLVVQFVWVVTGG